MRIPTFILLAIATVAFAEDPIGTENRQLLKGGLEERKAEADDQLAKNPQDVTWLTRRGDLRLFLGDAKGAVEDFEKEIALDPSLDTPHWRLGIAYHFAGQWEKSAAQFVKYHTYDNRDRENGIWQYLANARVRGIEAARKEMLEYTRFDREPFPDLYDMLAGKKTSAEVLAAAKDKGLEKDDLAMFFAHYYAGLHEQLLGNAAAAEAHLATALKHSAKAGAKGGPGYMGHVARLHYDARNTPIGASAKVK